jgi:rhodanese-related sulfurtransferase
MVAESDPGGVQRQEDGAQQRALAKFRWAAPDRLNVEGSFGSGERPDGDFVLVLRGPDGERRLLATDHETDPDGSWRAVFVWDAPPMPFDYAHIEAGDNVIVALLDALPADASDEPELVDVRAASPPARDDVPPAEGVERLRMQTALAAVHQELDELRTAAGRTAAELERAKADLQAEREGRAAEAEEFRDTLASLRASAEQAIADAEQQRATRSAELIQALAARDAELAELRDRAERAADMVPLATQARDAAQRLLDRLAEAGDIERDDGA